ncbi:Acetylcholinesterase [Dactylella cylindrospora]|nr:Acetylcholinesterase [Dactylella cylindrospora]
MYSLSRRLSAIKLLEYLLFCLLAMLSYRAFLLLTQVLHLYSTPSAGSMPNDPTIDLTLSILTDNDLNAADTARTTHAILIESAHSRNTAPYACALLNESLLSVDTIKFAAGLNNTLSYQKYLSKFPKTQRLWVNSFSGCIAIDFDGHTHTEDCHKRLPVLCSNSAPLGNSTYSDTSARWHTSRKVGNQIVTGYRDRNSFRFIGIRYAADPGRFVHSEVYAGSGQVDAIDYGSQCLQNIMMSGNLVGEEDCLFLNLWTPYLPGKAANLKNLKPVVVWVHGGGLVQGTANDPGTDGGNLASRGDIVVVGINYRLGSFGFLSINGEASGNYGIGDMITALKWVKANIKAFGGDPSKVTIMGQSGGAAGLRGVLASKKSKGLISGAIIHSGPWGFGPQKVYSEFYTSSESAATVGLQLAKDVGCDGAADKLACLKSIDADDIAKAPTFVNYPLMDGDYIESSLGVTGKGYAANVPILIGTVRDEIAIINAAVYGLPDAAQIVDIMGSSVLQTDLTGVVSDPAFPPPPRTQVESAFSVANRILSDYGMTCLTWATAYSMAKHRVVPAVYAYSFNRTYQPAGWNNPICNPPATAEHPLGDFGVEYYKCHAGEISLVFGLVKYTGQVDRDGLDIKFSQLSLDTWAAFIRTGDPNPDVGYLRARGYWDTLGRVQKSGVWEKVSVRNQKLQVLQWESHQIGFTEGPQCQVLGLPLSYYEDL